jgi:hypothetical protein
MTIINPTVGRIVWFHPNGQQFDGLREIDAAQPMAAQVAFVNSERYINLLVTDHAGRARPVGGVYLVQDGDEAIPGPGTCYAEWMPFQKGQARAQSLSLPVVDPGAGNVAPPPPAGGTPDGAGGYTFNDTMQGGSGTVGASDPEAPTTTTA